MRILLGLFFFTMLGSGAFAELSMKTVEYKAGNTVLKGYLAYDSGSPEKRPGILVVHEWWGLNRYPKRVAENLAGMGYTALAVDMYGGGKATTNSKEAGAWAGEVKSHPELIRLRLQAALDELRRQPSVDPKRIAAIGYCFGGTVVLEAARMGMDISGVVSFHGGLRSSLPPGDRKIHARVLVLHGADDPSVSREDIVALQKELRGAKADWQMNFYGGATHAFSNPEANMPPMAKYNPSAAKRSWAAMRLFLEELSANH